MRSVPLLIAITIALAAISCDPGDRFIDCDDPSAEPICLEFYGAGEPDVASGDTAADALGDGADAGAAEGEVGGDGEVTEAADYPEGPYGTETGDVTDNLSFLDADGEVFEFGSIYRDPEVRLVLVSTSAWWCGACRDEQPELQALYREHRDRGFLVIAAIFEDEEFNPATLAHATGWRDMFGLTFPVVLDDEFVFANYYDRSLTPMNMFIDGSTMRIISVATGFDRTEVEATIDRFL